MTANESHSEKLQLLRATPLLSGLKEESFNSLARAGRIVKLSKGAYLFHQDDPADSLIILRAGEIAILLNNIDGREMIINEVRPVDCFGEVSILSGSARTAGALARENSELLEIGAGAFLTVLDAEPALTRRMLELAAKRLVNAHYRENALAFLDARARVARVMLEMDEADRRGADLGYITLSQEELAQRTGLARQTVARELGNWRRQGWLLTGRGQIMLLNRAALYDVAKQKS